MTRGELWYRPPRPMEKVPIPVPARRINPECAEACGREFPYTCASADPPNREVSSRQNVAEYVRIVWFPGELRFGVSRQQDVRVPQTDR